MVIQGAIIKDNYIETTLMNAENGITLIKIPPPVNQADLLDISNWNLKDVVWTGKLRFVEKEQLDTDAADASVVEKELIVGVIQFVNSDGKVFAETSYNIDGKTVKITSYKRVFRIIIEYEGKKIAFGLVFLDIAKAQEFSIALQTLRRDAQNSIEARNEINSTLTGTIQSLHLREPQKENDTEDDFGDFVSG